MFYSKLSSAGMTQSVDTLHIHFIDKITHQNNTSSSKTHCNKTKMLFLEKKANPKYSKTKEQRNKKKAISH